MIAPKLNKGDAIGVFSPSSPATATARVRYGRGKAYLESKGYRIVEGDLTGRKDFYRSGSIAQRVDELNALIRNPDVRFPVLAQFDCCHTHPMLTLPIGCRVGLDADAQRLTILREDDEGI